MIYLSCDYETNNSRTECRVWLYGIYNIFTEHFLYGNCIEDFYYTINNYCKKEPGTLSFHNLKFDGEFFVIYLLNNGYTLVKDKKSKLNKMEFRTLISDLGVWYTIEYCSPYGKIIKIINTLCLFPSKLSELAKSLGLPEEKGKIDYDTIRPINYHASNEEIEYIRKDCVIAGKAWRYALENGDNRLTAGANALQFYKNLIEAKKWEHWFPKLSPEEDSFVRESYRGGWVYVNPEFKGKEIGAGKIYDVTSLFPSRMRYCPMPYGRGVFFTGQYNGDQNHPLYVQRFQCSFELKKNKLPTIQLKKNFGFHKTEYCKSSHGEIIELTLTNVDLKLFFDQYKVKNLYYIDGYMYKATTGMFDGYIDYWLEQKTEAGLNGDMAKRVLSKLKLNSLYGKFAKRPKGRSKFPALENGCLKLELGDEEEQGALYIPVGTFVTAYARDYTIRAAQENYKNFLYSDTDSIHLLGDKPPKGMIVHPTNLGEWKEEGTFLHAKYLGAKCYEESIVTPKNKLIKFLREHPMQYMQVNFHEETLLDIKCAGLPDDCKDGISFDDFKEDLTVDSKLKPVHVPGGVMLERTTYKIKPR